MNRKQSNLLVASLFLNFLFVAVASGFVFHMVDKRTEAARITADESFCNARAPGDEIDDRYIQLGMTEQEEPIVPTEVGGLYQIWSNAYIWLGEVYDGDGNIIGHYYEVPLHLPKNSYPSLLVFSPKDLSEQPNQIRSFKGVLWTQEPDDEESGVFSIPETHGDNDLTGYACLYDVIRLEYCLYEQVDGAYPGEVQKEYDDWLNSKAILEIPEFFGEYPNPSVFPNTGDDRLSR